MRYDFHHYLQIDIDDFFLGRRSWETFVELVGQLPRGSNYQCAVLDDDELIHADIERNGKPKPAKRPPLRGWDAQRADAADIKDLLQVLIATVARSDKPINQWPRPEDAYDRYEAMERKKNTDWLFDQLGVSLD